MRALISGATGFIGESLFTELEAPAVLTRDPERARGRLPGAAVFAWAPDSGPPPAAAFAGVDAVFHLAGEPVAAARWTADQKQRIRDSRVLATRNLVAGLAALPQRPRVLVSASAVGYYGDRGDAVLDETAPPGQGFLADVCAAWEHEAMQAEPLGVRVVCVRTGIVLAPGGGALQRMLTPFRLGIGGRLGSGRQWMPWIHRADVVGLLLHASRSESVRGALNAVAPGPVRNAEFARTLGRALHRPALLPVPAAMLRLVFGERSELLTASQRVLPAVAERTGYAFRYGELSQALQAALAAPERPPGA